MNTTLIGLAVVNVYCCYCCMVVVVVAAFFCCCLFRAFTTYFNCCAYRVISYYSIDFFMPALNFIFPLLSMDLFVLTLLGIFLFLQMIIISVYFAVCNVSIANDVSIAFMKIEYSLTKRISSSLLAFP